jgi:hypothetical protein
LKCPLDWLRICVYEDRDRANTGDDFLTQCTEGQPELQLRFDCGLGKPVVGTFDAGQVSSDGGLMLVRGVDERLRLSEQISYCLADSRQEGKIKHSVVSQIRQRLNMIAAGYEDLNDADKLAHDGMHKIVAGRNPETDLDLASDATLGRLENSRTEEELTFLQELLVHVFIQQQRTTPKRIILDMDTTCDEVHGYQQLSFYNGFYKTYCYTPLFIFAGSFPLAAVLRAGNAAPAEGGVRALKPVIAALRKAWPEVVIDLRADAGFSTPELYKFCEEVGIYYYIGLKPNGHTHLKARPLISRAKTEFMKLHGPVEELTTKQAKKKRKEKWRRKEERIRFASKEQGRMQEHFEDEDEHRTRLVGDIDYQADSWKINRRVIARCDYTAEGADIRYIVTNYMGGRPKWIYEDKYCKRGQCENYIKELKALKCDRLSGQEFPTNQFRLLMHTFAYILIDGLKKLLPRENSTISVETVRNRLIKIAVVVKETARQIRLHWTSHSPWESQFRMIAMKL